MLNIGSIIKIEIAQADDITLGTPNDNNEVTVANSGSWDEPEFTIETAGWNETEKTSMTGLRYESTLKYQLPKVDPSNHQAAHQYANVPIVIRITDGNKNKIVIGDSLNPAFIQVVKNIPAQASEINAYQFAVKYESPHPAYFSA